MLHRCLYLFLRNIYAVEDMQEQRRLAFDKHTDPLRQPLKEQGLIDLGGGW